MALIKCLECGNDVSEKAGVCPQCGNPISLQVKETKKISIKLIIGAIGSILIILAPFLPYVSVRLSLPGDETINKYNMWKVLTPEAGGLKSGESAGFYGMIPTLLVILGIIGLILVVLQIVKDIEIKSFIKVIVPVSAIILLVLFETSGLSTFRETNNQFAEIFSQYDLGDMISVKKGIGIYLLVIGIVTNIISTFIKRKIKEG